MSPEQRGFDLSCLSLLMCDYSVQNEKPEKTEQRAEKPVITKKAQTPPRGKFRQGVLILNPVYRIKAENKFDARFRSRSTQLWIGFGRSRNRG